MTNKKEKYKWAFWGEVKHYTGLTGHKCLQCGGNADHLAIAETIAPFDSEYVVIKALCEEHFNKKTQKPWLRKWRHKACPV